MDCSYRYRRVLRIECAGDGLPLLPNRERLRGCNTRRRVVLLERGRRDVRVGVAAVRGGREHNDLRPRSGLFVEQATPRVHCGVSVDHDERCVQHQLAVRVAY